MNNWNSVGDAEMAIANARNCAIARIRVLLLGASIAMLNATPHLKYQIEESEFEGMKLQICIHDNHRHEYIHGQIETCSPEQLAALAAHAKIWVYEIEKKYKRLMFCFLTEAHVLIEAFNQVAK